MTTLRVLGTIVFAYLIPGSLSILHRDRNISKNFLPPLWDVSSRHYKMAYIRDGTKVFLCVSTEDKFVKQNFP